MDHELTNAIYTVKLNTADLPMTTRTEPVLRSGNYWVFYTATVGNLRQGITKLASSTPGPTPSMTAITTTAPAHHARATAASATST